MKSFYLGGCREVEIVREDEGLASILACHVLRVVFLDGTT